MTASEMLRPAEAAKRFGVSRQTLIEWAHRGLIGRSCVPSKRGQRGVVFYRESDIADLIASNMTPRQVVPLTTTAAVEPVEDWRSDPFWAGVR